MSSVGIPEGTVIKDDDYCSCVWFSTASIPPIRTLEKKCDNCKQKEEELLKGEAPSTARSGHDPQLERLRAYAKIPLNLRRYN